MHSSRFDYRFQGWQARPGAWTRPGRFGPPGQRGPLTPATSAPAGQSGQYVHSKIFVNVFISYF